MFSSQLRRLFNKSLKKIFQARKLPVLSKYSCHMLNVLWLLTTLIIAEKVYSENSCPEFAPYYCACSWTDIAEVTQLRMCLNEDIGEGDCHPCPERLQENVNCDSCDDNVCPICIPLNFGRGKPSSAHLKQPALFRFNRHGGILHTRPFSLQGYHNLYLQNAKNHIFDNLNSSNNQTVMSNVFFSRSQDSSKRYPQVKVIANMDANTEKTSSNPNEEREEWIKFPKQESSQMQHKKIHYSKIMNDNDFKAKLFEERKNAKPVELRLGKLYIPELTLSDKRNGYVNLNDPNYLESDFEKLKFRKHAGKNKKIYLLHKLPIDKIKPVTSEKFINNEQEKLDKNLKNDHFILLLRPLDISGNGDHTHQNIPGKIKTHGNDKYHFQNVPDDSGLDDIQCSFTSESSKISFNDHAVDLSAIEENIQKCISEQTINIYDNNEKIQPLETSCNISFSQAVLFKCIGSEVGNETDLPNMRFRETVKVYDSNLTDKFEVITEITNVTVQHLSDSDESTLYDKTIHNSLNGKINIEIRFSLKKSPDNFLSHLPDQEVFGQHDLPVEDDIKIESDNKFKNNHWPVNWMEKAYLEDEMNDINPNFSDSEGEKNDMFINTIDQEHSKTKFLDFLDSLMLDNKAKNNKLHAYHMKFDDEIENTDFQEKWREQVYYKPKVTDKETESENLLENSVDEIKEPFKKIKELFITGDLPGIAEITNSLNAEPNNHLKRVIRDIPRFLSSRSSKDPPNSDKIVMMHQSVLQLFSLGQGPVKSQNSPSALWFRYRKSALIPNINEIVDKNNMKKSDIFKLLNVSISSLKKSKMYKSDCEACSVMYKIMLDSGIKNDPRLMESVNYSTVVLMSKPQFSLYPHKSKVRIGSQKKNKKSTKNVDSFTIQMDINFLFLSSDDYTKLNRKNTAKNNPLRNTPWADMKRTFVFKIPESFSSQSKIQKLTRSLKHKNLRPVVNELFNQDEFTEELQKILFALLSKMHEKKPKRSMGNFGSDTMIFPTISSLRIRLNEIEKFVNDQAGKDWLKVNLKEGNNPFPASTVQDPNKGHEEPTNKIASNDISQQIKNGAVQTNIKEWKQREGNNPQITLMQTGVLKHSETVTDEGKKSEKNGNSNNVETAQQQMSFLKNKDLEASGLGNIVSPENISIKNPMILKANTHYVSETLKSGNEKLTGNNGLKPIETMKGAFTLKTILGQNGDGLRKIREAEENTLNGIGGVTSLQKLDGVIHFGLDDNENLHHRERRQLVAIPHNNWCPVRSMRRNGHLDCSMWTFKKKCTIHCHSGYSYDGKANVEMSCSRRQNKWTSDVNKPCTGSGREMPEPERIERPERPDKGSAPRPTPPRTSPGEGKPQKVPPKVLAAAKAEENDDYYEEYDYQ